MEDSLRSKLSALEWIPNGEVDDTRFEKLLDDLVEILADEEKRISLFNVGLISTLSRTISHDDERISSISIKLLGRLSFLVSNPSSPSSLLIESSTQLSLRLISTWKDLSPDTDPIIVESLCLFLSSWIPVLVLDSVLSSSILPIIKCGLYSTSHFVRSSAVGAFQAMCNSFVPPHPTSQCSANQAHLKASIQSLTTQIVTHPSSQTVFAIVSAVSSSPLYFILQDHPAIDLLWDAIIDDTDSILAECARCCARTMLENEHGNLLVPSSTETPSHLISRIEMSMMHSLRRKTRNSIINCISLLELKAAKQGDLNEPFSYAFREFAQSSIIEILLQLTEDNSDTSTSPKHLFTIPLGQLAASDANKKTLVFDVLLSVLIKSSIDAHCWSQIVPILLKGIHNSFQTYLNKSSTTPSSFWTFISKTCKLLISLPFFDPFQNSTFLLELMSQLLSYIATPVTTKVALLSLLQHVNSLALCTPSREADWHWFDEIYDVLKACRFSQAWEVRHSVIQLVGSLATQCPDMNGILERNLFQIIVSGMIDASEHVREATHTYLTQTRLTRAIFDSIVDGHPSFLWNLFCTVDAQSSSRVSQAGLISAFFRYDLVLEELAKVPDFHSVFHHTIHGLISDDDWDVRQSALSIMEVVISFEPTRRQHYWKQWKCEEALQILLNDESRMVKLSAWTFLKDHSNELELLRNMEGNPSLDIEEISTLISDLAVEAHYNPDDEVYPLAPNVADNDLDCPF